MCLLTQERTVLSRVGVAEQRWGRGLARKTELETETRRKRKRKRCVVECWKGHRRDRGRLARLDEFVPALLWHGGIKDKKHTYKMGSR